MKIKINNQEHNYNTDKNLLDFLREDLNIVSLKNGCAEGACGTCMVLIDNKAKKACIQKLSRLENANILTLEGLPPKVKNSFTVAFSQCGAVQCGFCIPGMIISAYALLLINPQPSRQEIKKALRGNICRCTGYKKIIEAVELAAKLLAAKQPSSIINNNYNFDKNLPRIDAENKANAMSVYVDDIKIEGMLHASALRSAYPRAIIKKIDISAAINHPDCREILLKKDIPGNPKIGHIEAISDWDVLLGEGDTTRYLGDALALIISDKKSSLAAIKDLIVVDYQVLKPLSSPAEALAENAPKLHQKGNLLCQHSLQRGNIDQALAKAAFVVKNHYSLPFTEHAFLEPECAIAQPDGEDGLLLFTAGQSIYDEQREIARMLGIERSKIRIQGQTVGGAFGGKEDMSVQHHAALAAWHMRLPVKVLLSRQESIIIHPKRHAMEIDCLIACDKEGRLLAIKEKIIADTGAYASLGGPVLQRACTHGGGPYRCPNIDIEGLAVYTNNPPGGAFRGFGVSQIAYALENNLNQLAALAGISPWQIRHINAVIPGDILASGQIADNSTAIVECLEAIKDDFEQAKYVGLAAALKNCGLGMGISDSGRARIIVQDEAVHIYTSAACIGQGLATVLKQIAYQTLKIDPQKIIIAPPDTATSPDSGTTTASRQTVFSGEATRLAALKLKEALDKGHNLASLDGEQFFGEYQPPTDPLASTKAEPLNHVAYGYGVQMVELNEQGELKKVIAAYDGGQIINRLAAEGQIEGGIIMGLGYALTEDYPLKECYPQANFGRLGLWRADQIPEIEIRFVQAKEQIKMAYGAKGLGELATIPAAPALSGAYYAFNQKMHLKLPIKSI